MKDLGKGTDPACIPQPEIDWSTWYLIKGLMQEMDLIGGVYPYDVQRAWPEWYARCVRSVHSLWGDTNGSQMSLKNLMG